MAQGIPYDVRFKVIERAKGRCELCGLVVKPRPAHLHHRRPRGMGGSKANPHRASNLLHLHPTCHLFRVERKRQESLTNGWIVQQALDPSMIPVLMWDGWWYLHDDGSLDRCDPP